MRFDWAPLEARLKVTEFDAELCTVRHLQALKLAVPARQVSRFREYGLDFWQADRAAIRLGWVPWVIWPEWLDESMRRNDVDDPTKRACAECGSYFVFTNKIHSYCSAECRNVARNSRLAPQRAAWRAENRDRLKADKREYYAAHAEKVKAARRAHYLRNREQELARQKVYDARKRGGAA